QQRLREHAAARADLEHASVRAQAGGGDDGVARGLIGEEMLAEPGSHPFYAGLARPSCRRRKRSAPSFHTSPAPSVRTTSPSRSWRKALTALSNGAQATPLL